MKEFKLRKKDGAALECESCGVETETIKVEVAPHRLGMRTDTCELLCSLCYTTFIGNAHQYPDQYPHVTPQMFAQAIHWLKNELLVQLKKGASK